MILQDHLSNFITGIKQQGSTIRNDIPHPALVAGRQGAAELHEAREDL